MKRTMGWFVAGVIALAIGVPALRSQEGARGQALADRIMTGWAAKHPGRSWVMPPASSLAAFAQNRQHEAYNRDSPGDEFVRKAEFDKFVAEGKRIFHDAEAFGGTVGVSCDMCHPDASNTHPETYPKYQVQMQKVALLRDMINWCIQNPTKGKPLADGDPRLRAMEAYIYSTRKGTALDPGKR